MKPLSNVKVIELAGLAPVPFCGMMLSDFGAKVIRIDNFKAAVVDDVLNRGKQSVCLNLKQSEHFVIFKKLLKTVDVLLDPYRPGVLEKLNLSPSELQRDNPQLIIARLTGYGQPSDNDSRKVLMQKSQAGHDINYVAMSGLLSKLGSDSRDFLHPPLNIVGDFAAGALNCTLGIILALFNRVKTGQGEVIDCSMTAGTSYLSSFIWNSRDQLPFIWPQPDVRGANLLDGGAPFYRCYRTNDNKFIAVGAIEPKFYDNLLKVLEISASDAPQFDYALWPALCKKFSDKFVMFSQEEWTDKASLIGDCCLTPVLSMENASEFWKNSFFHDSDGKMQPKPQPVFKSFKQADSEDPIPSKIVVDTESVLREFGCSQEEISSVLFAITPKL